MKHSLRSNLFLLRALVTASALTFVVACDDDKKERTDPDAQDGSDAKDGDDAQTDGDDAQTDGDDAQTDGDDAQTDGDDAQTDGDDAQTDGDDAQTDGDDAQEDGSDGEVVDFGEKLRACGLIGEGQVSPGYTEQVSACLVACLDSASCDDLKDLECSDSDERTPFIQCIEACPDVAGGEPITCADGQVVEDAIRCDAAEDCNDGSDEVGCEYFTCGDGEKISLDWECDFEADCQDGSDEHAQCAVLMCGG